MQTCVSTPSWDALQTQEAKLCIEFLHTRLATCPLVPSGDLK